MSFQIVYPIAMSINADSFKDAIKQYVKLNQDINIANIIITDQQRYMKANLKYYQEGNKNKMGISLYPTSNPLSFWPFSTQISYDTKEYPGSTFVETPVFMPRIVPLMSDPLGSTFLNLSPTSPLVSDIFPLSPIAPVVKTFGFF